ncbi:unnamed protein product [Callosobruchus maculatus]|nr:unnamed protein product [Callosobruchus maculatus]
MDYNVNPKLEKVLKKLLEPDFKIKNEVYLNQLLTHITDQSATSLDSKSIDKVNRSYYVSWFKTAIEKWDAVSPPRQNFLTFAVHLAAFLCSDEQTFVRLNCENVFERLAKVTNRFNSPGVKLANIKLLTAFLEHKSGLQWVISTNSWNDVLTTALNCPTVYISKEACSFLTRLLEKSIDMNEAFCANIMYLILIPLKLEKEGIDEESYYVSLKPSLVLISNILELLLQRATVNCVTTKKILAKFNLEKHLATLKNSQNKNVFFDVYSILHLIGFFELLFKFGGIQEPIDFQRINQPSMKYCGITEKFSETLSNPQMLCFLGNSLRYWSHIRHKMTLCVNDGSIPMQFENQLMILQLLPVAMISMRLINPNPDNLSGNDDIRDMFFTKIIKNSLPNTFRVVYKWKARFPNQTSFSDASMGLKYFLHSKQHYSRDVANTAFQMLLYTLRDVTDVVKEKPQMVPLTGEAVSFLVLLLTAIVELIKGFSLTWKDSVETVAVLEIAFNCLNFPTWPAKVVVKGLELVDVAISKYMSPNMALLIDKVHDSVMGLLGPMLYAKLHDIHWEVRDSALEVICTITRISNKKFPSYRKVIQEAEFPSMIIRLAKTDNEAFVRASALKCLKEMIQVDDFWWDFQNSFNIFEEILNILVYEPEGIVRSEAATVVATIYEYQDVPESSLGNMYDVASHAATADLHWEVKAKTLMFWSKVIEKHLTHQGMIDGTFPEVTFSKENRKIVTLNDAEVKKRLIKVLEQLSATGCLAVFAAALQDDSDLEVAKTALDLIKDFVSMLKKYKVTEQDLVLSAPVSPLDRFSNSPFSSVPSVRSLDSQYGTMSPASDLFQMDLAQSVASTPIDEAILESILDSEDIGLLDAVSNSPNQVAETEVNLKTKQIMPSRHFLNFIYGDLDGRLKERSRWLEQIDSFDSLLDDILKDYQVEGVNAMDCY